MAAVIEDVLQTRLDLVGVGAYTSGWDQATRAIGLNTDALGENQRAQLQGAVATGVIATGMWVGLGRATMAAADEQAIMNRAASNFKGQFPADEVAKLGSEMQQLTGVADDQVASFLGLLGTFQVTRNQAETLALPILNAAEALKAQGATTEGIALQVGKALQTGEPTALRRSGIILDEVAFKAASADERVRMLADALNAQGGADAAANFRKTLPGAVMAMTNALGDAEEALGGPFVGLLNEGANTVERFATGFASLPEPLRATAGVVVGAVALGLTLLSARMAWSVIQAGMLAGANARLTASMLENAAAAQTQAAALGQVGATGLVGPVMPGGVGMMRGAGGFLRGPGGIGLLTAGAGMAVSAAVGEDETGQNIGSLLTGAGTGAAFGAMAGPMGALIGGVAGIVISGVGILMGRNAEEQKQTVEKQEDPKDKQIAHLQEIIAELKGIRGAFSGKDIPYSQQVAAGWEDLVS